MTNENQQGTKTTRRNFLKGAGLALAGATAFGLAGCASGEADSASSNEKWDGEYDVIVAGAGIAGLTAAITVADEGDGASCLVVEKDSLPNGNSPFCAGWQLYFDETDGPMNYLGHLIGESTPEATIRAFVEESKENLNWILGLGAKEEWLNIYEPDPSGEETNEYAEYPDDNTVGFLLFKTEGDQPHHIHEFLFSEMKKRNDTIEYKASTPLESLVRDASTGEVTGVVAGGKSYRAKRGVIMCTGGLRKRPGYASRLYGRQRLSVCRQGEHWRRASYLHESGCRLLAYARRRPILALFAQHREHPVRFDVVLVYGEAARHHRRRERTKVLPGLRRMQQFQKICAARYRHNSQRRLPTRHHAVRWRYGAPSLAGKGLVRIRSGGS